MLYCVNTFRDRESVCKIRSNVAEHVLPDTPLHRHGLTTLQLDASFASIPSETGHLEAQLLVHLSHCLLFRYGLLLVFSLS